MTVDPAASDLSVELELTAKTKLNLTKFLPDPLGVCPVPKLAVELWPGGRFVLALDAGKASRGRAREMPSGLRPRRLRPRPPSVLAS